jgi:hypothetical protein
MVSTTCHLGRESGARRPCGVRWGRGLSWRRTAEVDLRDSEWLWVFDGGTTRRGGEVVRRGEAAGVWPNSVMDIQRYTTD